MLWGQQKSRTNYDKNFFKYNSNSNILKYICDLIILDLQPFSIVEDNGFRSFLKFAFPNFETPCRNTIRNKIEKIYNEEVSKLIETFKNVKYISLTTDMWTSSNNESFITVTSHFIHQDMLFDAVLENKGFGLANHTSENILIQIETICDKFNIKEKVIL